MAEHDRDLTSVRIKGYVQKLYGEIVEEMDSFLESHKEGSGNKKPFNRTFSDLENTRPNLRKIQTSSWGSRGALRDKYFSFAKEPPLASANKTSSRFLSSFEQKEERKGFDSRKYFDSTPAPVKEVKAPKTQTLTSLPKDWNSIWQTPLEEKVSVSKKESSSCAPSPRVTKRSHLFEDTTDSIIPALKSKLETIPDPEKGIDQYHPINLLPKSKTAPKAQVMDEETRLHEMESLLSPLVGMKNDDLAETKKGDESKFLHEEKIDLEDQLEDFINSPSKIALHQSFWCALEQEDSLEDLFSSAALPSTPLPLLSTPESNQPVEAVLLALEHLPTLSNETSSSLGKEDIIDPFFASLEEAFYTPPSQKEESESFPFLVNKKLGQEEILTPQPLEQNESLSPSNFLQADMGSLAWAGEIRWHLLARRDLELFRAGLPENFLICDGSCILGKGKLEVKAWELSGRLPNWTEDVDQNHLVVGIVKIRKC